MPMWRCPHCGTPQAETARCWVCRRSSTSCGTCRHYRRSVAGAIGYCGLDKRRDPLTGDEIRGCWEAWPATLLGEAALPVTIAPAQPLDGDRHRLAFIEVDAGSEADGAPEAAPQRATAPGLRPTAEPGWVLWGDLDT